MIDMDLMAFAVFNLRALMMYQIYSRILAIFLVAVYSMISLDLSNDGATPFLSAEAN
jgi:hypothetical protein